MNISITVNVQEINISLVIYKMHWRMKKITTEKGEKNPHEAYNFSEK